MKKRKNNEEIGEGEYSWVITLAYYECPDREEYQRDIKVNASSREAAIKLAKSECTSEEIVYLVDDFKL